MAKVTNKATNVEERFSFSVRMAPKLPQAVPNVNGSTQITASH